MQGHLHQGPSIRSDQHDRCAGEGVTTMAGSHQVRLHDEGKMGTLWGLSAWKSECFYRAGRCASEILELI